MVTIAWGDRGATFRIGTYRNLVLAAWHSPPTLEQARTMIGASAPLRRSHPRGVALFNMIPGGGMPDFSEAVRKELTQATRSDTYAIAVAHVILVPGLVGAAVRAFVSTLLLVGRPTNPQRAFGDCETAGDWVLPRLVKDDPTWTREELREAYEAVLRARYPG